MPCFSLALAGSQAEADRDHSLRHLLTAVAVAATLFTALAVVGYCTEQSRSAIHVSHVAPVSRLSQLAGVLRTNYRCAFLECSGVFTLGFMNVVTLCGNGLQFGMFLRASELRTVLRWIAPHLVLELLSILLISGASLWLTYLLAFWLLGRTAITRRTWSIFFCAEAIGWAGITVAAVIEVYVTPWIATGLGRSL